MAKHKYTKDMYLQMLEQKLGGGSSSGVANTPRMDAASIAQRLRQTFKGSKGLKQKW